MTVTSTPDAVRFDAHGIDPIPPQDRDSRPREQFWIWAGANLAPINWVLGALGITLGLSLLETILIVAVGNVLGCGLFGLLNVIGHRTAVTRWSSDGLRSDAEVPSFPG
jgi:NCS1 family nucleobase:cation symporter-1